MIISGLMLASTAIVLILFLGILIAKFYKRASADMAIVRTGNGKMKICMDGGIFVIPLIHKSFEINLKTLPVEVDRNGSESLITKDNLRADVKAIFYVRVSTEDTQITSAARTLGSKTLNIQEMKTFIEDKLVGALRAIAATKDLTDLNSKREDFAESVQTALKDELLQNGIVLESVTIANLDQAKLDDFRPDNIFDSTGKKNVAAIVQDNRKLENEIVRKAEVEIEKKNVETRKNVLALQQDQAFATAEQDKEIRSKKATQDAAAKKIEAEQAQTAEVAVIEKEKTVALTSVEKDKTVRVETQNADKAAQVAEVEKKQAVEIAVIAKEKQVQISEKEKEISVLQKEKERVETAAETAKADAERVKAEQAVLTITKVAEYDREKQAAIIEQEKKSEIGKIEIVISADAEAEKIMKIAKAKLDAAKMDAEAIKVIAEANREKFTVDAKGKELMVGAENVISNERLMQLTAMSFIEKLPSIIEKLVEPANSIDEMKILNINGVGSGIPGISGGVGNDGTTGGTNSSTPNIISNIISNVGQVGLFLPVLNSLIKFARENPTSLINTINRLPLSDDVKKALPSILNHFAPGLVPTLEKEIAAPEKKDEATEPTAKGKDKSDAPTPTTQQTEKKK